MAEIERINVEQARRKAKSKAALLVCAYEDEAKYQQMKLDGAISLASFQSLVGTLPKNQEIIFYCA